MIQKNQNGCDSLIINLNLSVSQNTVYDSVSVLACEEYSWFGQTYSNSGFYQHVVTSAQCTDSIFVLDLEITQSIVQNTMSACDSVYFQNNWYYTNASATESYPIPNSLCDSTIETQINILSSTYDTIITQACDSYIFGNQTLTTSGQYNWVGQNAQGCNDYHHLNLSVVESISTSQNISNCGQMSWGNQILTQSGTYTQTFLSPSACNSLVTLNLTVNPTHEVVHNFHTCDPQAITPTFYYFTNSFGCDSVLIIQPIAIPDALRAKANFSISPNPASLANTSMIDIVNLSVNASEYQWTIPSINYTSNSPSPTGYSFGQAGQYEIWLTVDNEHNCPDSMSILLYVQDEILVYVPNAFTPDGDAHNNIFLPIFAGPLDVYNYELLIFNRWEEVIFETRNPAIGWDGNYGGKIPVQDGTYIWKITYRQTQDASRYEINGHVTILR